MSDLTPLTSDQIVAGVLADLRLRGCCCEPEFEFVGGDGVVANLAIRHDDWCPVIHDPREN